MDPKGSKSGAAKAGGKEAASLSYARTLSWLSLIVVVLTSLVLSFFISNQARQALMERSEGFTTLLAHNLNNQIFQRFAVPTILRDGHISLRQQEQYELLDSVVKSVIVGLPVSRLRLYDHTHVIAYSTDPSEIGRRGGSYGDIESALKGQSPRPTTLSRVSAWKLPFVWPLEQGSFELRVFYPLRGDAYTPAPSPVLGVLELTQDITEDYVQVLSFQWAIVGMCLLSSVIIFVLLIFMIRRAEAVLTLRMQKNMQLEKELQSTEKLVSMGRVVASIAHEIRNPLGIIRSTAELLQRRSATSQDRGTQRLLQAIYDESVRLSQTVNDFLDYARPRQPKQENVDLGAVVDQILAFVESDFSRDGVKAVKRFDADLRVLGDKDLLYRALYNVLMNGRQAMKGPGTIDVHGFVLDGMAAVDVTDSGRGFDPDVMDKLFEPFFTTREGGTGLGLPIVRSIVVSHGGDVRLSNPPEGGARVEILLPPAPAPEEAGDRPERPE